MHVYMIIYRQWLAGCLESCLLEDWCLSVATLTSLTTGHMLTSHGGGWELYVISTSYICTVHIYRHGDEVDGGHYLHVHTLSIHACI